MGSSEKHEDSGWIKKMSEEETFLVKVFVAIDDVEETYSNSKVDNKVSKNRCIPNTTNMGNIPINDIKNGPQHNELEESFRPIPGTNKIDCKYLPKISR